MAKKKRDKPQRILTPHQISHWEQQKKRQRLILMTGIFVIVAALAIVIVGWYLGQFKPLRETVIKVNDTEFTMDYYVEMLKIEGSYHQVPDVSYVADSVLQNIPRNELTRQGALELGISVTDEEVKNVLKENDLPDKEVYRDLVRHQLLIERLLDVHFDPQVPLFAEQRQVMAMMLENEPQALDVRSKLVSGDDFSELAEEMSLEPLSRSKGGDFGWVPRTILLEMLPVSIVDVIFDHEVGELSRPIYDEETEKFVGYWLVEVLERDEDEEEAHIQIMLLGSEEEALNVRSQLEAGAEWGSLAVERSQVKGVKENKGEWLVSPGEMNPLVDVYAFDPDTEIGAISEPIRDENITTKGGYWLIKIPDEDTNRRIDTAYRDYLKSKALDEWVASVVDEEDNEIVNYLDAEKKSWAIEQAARG
ncbi:MAG: peptidylprolyl isomerase [Dehalococcoidales bacterium]|nr:peptidylprolyl isomerase [Dehalococcoidales bacterium]